MKIVIATGNINKLKEIGEKFSSIRDMEILSLKNFNDPPAVIEDGATFQENALKKARAISAFTGLSALADDSGLTVDALDGRPGVLSARYGGEGTDDEEKNRLILDEMKEVPDNQRGAAFVCAVAIVIPDGREFTVEGICRGAITRAMKGNNGFGYDPIFFLPELNKTMAELTLSEKNRISHRAIALEKALAVLKEIF